MSNFGNFCGYVLGKLNLSRISEVGDECTQHVLIAFLKLRVVGVV
jgi:hypothetical protein